MLRFDPGSGNLGVAHNGRVAAHFYIQAESVATFIEMFGHIPVPSDSDLCRIICSATEFRNMKLRQEEMDELQQVAAKACPFRIKGLCLWLRKDLPKARTLMASRILVLPEPFSP